MAHWLCDGKNRSLFNSIQMWKRGNCQAKA